MSDITFIIIPIIFTGIFFGVFLVKACINIWCSIAFNVEYKGCGYIKFVETCYKASGGLTPKQVNVFTASILSITLYVFIVLMFTTLILEVTGVIIGREISYWWLLIYFVPISPFIMRGINNFKQTGSIKKDKELDTMKEQIATLQKELKKKQY